MALEWTEYIAVLVSLVSSVAISAVIYRRDSKRDGEENDNMRFSVWPIAVSMIATYTTGIALVGTPAEAYQYGIDFAVLYVLTNVLNGLATSFFLPVIYKMKGSSLYEYFRLRFDSKIERIANIQFILVKTFAIALPAMPPAIIIKYFEGVNLTVTLAALISITTLYTMIGGFRGVVWTDTFQAFVLLISFITMTVTSVLKVGGVSKVFQLAYRTDRLSVMTPTFDVTNRLSIWMIIRSVNISSVVHQSWYQKIKTLKSESEIKRSLFFRQLGLVAINCAAFFIGLAVFAYYYGCDPKEAMLIRSYASIIIHWLDEVGRNVPGLRGVCIAGITCASISTMSTNLNTIATMIVDEFQRPKDGRFGRIQLWTVIVGAVAAGISLFITDDVSLVELANMFNSLDGINSGLFYLGAFFIPATAKGAFAGGMTGLLVTLFLIIGGKLSGAGDALRKFQSKPMSTELCGLNTTGIRNFVKRSARSEVSFLFQISPFVYDVISLACTLVIGIIVSLVLPDTKEGAQRRTAVRDPDLYHPYVHRYLPKGLSATSTSSSSTPKVDLRVNYTAVPLEETLT